jgi:polysaccharide biosynthesis protein PslH
VIFRTFVTTHWTNKLRILFLQKRLVVPPNTGGKIRTFNVLRHLAQWHEVLYLSNLLPSEQVYLPEMHKIGVETHTIPWRESPRRSFHFCLFALKNLLTSRYPLNVDKDFDARLRQCASDLVTSRQVDLLVCDFVQMARNALGLPCPSVLFQHNVEAEIFARLARNSQWPWSTYLRNQSRRMAKFEAQASQRFTRVIAVSQRDKCTFEQRYGLRNVRTIDTSVDLDYFSQSCSDKRFNNRMVFVGSMDWEPNRQGILRFVHRILPLVSKTIVTPELLIVGRNPPADIRSLAEFPGVSVTGTVEDIRPHLQTAAVAIVPLYSGGGTRLKIFEAMASGVPVVSTTLGAEGLALRHGEHLLIADSDPEFAQAVVRILQDKTLAKSLAERATAHVSAHFGTETIARQFEAICLDAVAVGGSECPA